MDIIRFILDVIYYVTFRLSLQFVTVVTHADIYNIFNRVFSSKCLHELYAQWATQFFFMEFQRIV